MAIPEGVVYVVKVAGRELGNDSIRRYLGKIGLG